MLHGLVPAEQVPLWQVSSPLQYVPSAHAVPSASNASLGQAALDPVQVSATSQTPASARHVVVLGRKASTGQVSLTPLQASTTSQTPAVARQVVPFGILLSPGQAPSA